MNLNLSAQGNYDFEVKLEGIEYTVSCKYDFDSAGDLDVELMSVMMWSPDSDEEYEANGTPYNFEQIARDRLENIFGDFN